jgi:sortase B
MFRTLMSYEDEKFWKDHPQIQFSTLYENRTYEVLAAFYDRVYYKHEDVFKFYQFVNAETEENYKEAINYYKAHSLYDTGVTAEYGDRLLTLVTCAYHEEFGRFVVVARQLQ